MDCCSLPKALILEAIGSHAENKLQFSMLRVWFRTREVDTQQSIEIIPMISDFIIVPTSILQSCKTAACGLWVGHGDLSWTIMCLGKRNILSFVLQISWKRAKERFTGRASSCWPWQTSIVGGLCQASLGIGCWGKRCLILVGNARSFFSELCTFSGLTSALCSFFLFYFRLCTKFFCSLLISLLLFHQGLVLLVLSCQWPDRGPSCFK